MDANAGGYDPVGAGLDGEPPGPAVVRVLAAFGVLLHRLTGQDDLLVATPFADRREAAFERLVGCCLQILPLRLRPDTC